MVAEDPELTEFALSRYGATFTRTLEAIRDDDRASMQRGARDLRAAAESAVFATAVVLSVERKQPFEETVAQIRRALEREFDPRRQRRALLAMIRSVQNTSAGRRQRPHGRQRGR